jgi:hypothetical protein
MQRQLDDTHKQLAAEVAKRFTLEEAGARARLEAGRAGELAAQLAAERCGGGATRTAIWRFGCLLQVENVAGRPD